MKTLVAASMFLLSLTTNAVAEERPTVSTTPYAMMQKLAPLVGRWRLDTEMSNDGGATWNKMPSHMVNVSFRQKSLLLAEVPESTDGPGFHMETYISYDQYRKAYRSAAVDDVWGIMDIYEGTMDDAAIVLTNMKSGTFFPIGDGVWRGFRLTAEVKRPVRTMMIEKTDDNGTTWQPAFRLTYTLQE